MALRRGPPRTQQRIPLPLPPSEPGRHWGLSRRGHGREWSSLGGEAGRHPFISVPGSKAGQLLSQRLSLSVSPSPGSSPGMRPGGGDGPSQPQPSPRAAPLSLAGRGPSLTFHLPAPPPPPCPVLLDLEAPLRQTRSCKERLPSLHREEARKAPVRTGAHSGTGQNSWVPDGGSALTVKGCGRAHLQEAITPAAEDPRSHKRRLGGRSTGYTRVVATPTRKNGHGVWVTLPQPAPLPSLHAKLSLACPEAKNHTPNTDSSNFSITPLPGGPPTRRINHPGKGAAASTNERARGPSSYLKSRARKLEKMPL